MALPSKQPPVQRGFLVTGCTFSRRTPKPKVLVTGRAFQVAVRPFQQKDLSVVEVDHPVHTVVTFQAMGTVASLVGLHEGGVPLAVADFTRGRQEGKPLGVFMARGARDDLPGFRVATVTHQAKPQGLVIEGLALPAGGTPSLFGMAPVTCFGE